MEKIIIKPEDKRTIKIEKYIEDKIHPDGGYVELLNVTNLPRELEVLYMHFTDDELLGLYKKERLRLNILQKQRLLGSLYWLRN